jgi:thiamine phosphate synthase YjbQ (UPF0047 family)
MSRPLDVSRALVNAMHITVSMFINDDEPGLHRDYDVWLEKIAPHRTSTNFRVRTVAVAEARTR